MADPFAVTIATSVAAKIADNLTEGARQAVVEIVRKIRDKVRSRSSEPAEAATLDAAITSGDEPAAAALARLLEALFAADRRFREEIYALWDSGRPDDSVTDVFQGQADKVIMVRDVHGDLTIN
jgi:DNA helicase IV